MKPIFTIHAGEYLLGAYIESTYKNVNVWVPTKDTGIDLLVTDKDNSKSISYQVKFSKDWRATHISSAFHSGLQACGWWTLNSEKIRTSQADFWVFVLPVFNSKKQNFIVIKPAFLLERLIAIHGHLKTMQTYLWVTAEGKCLETRGLKKEDQSSVANGSFKDAERDFSKFLNEWGKLERLNNQK